jgi:NaMN:DMB phosphoribosyltransferase
MLRKKATTSVRARRAAAKLLADAFARPASATDHVTLARIHERMARWSRRQASGSAELRGRGRPRGTEHDKLLLQITESKALGQTAAATAQALAESHAEKLRGRGEHVTHTKIERWTRTLRNRISRARRRARSQ